MSGLTVIENIAARLPYGFGNVAAIPALTARAQHRSLFARIAASFAALKERRSTLRTLRDMSGRELADIGLRRDDVRLVFDPAFAARHEAARLRRAA